MAKKGGKYSKAKGSRFERKVRDELRRIYDGDQKSEINRVPMSGAGWQKGDVIDINDNGWSYEAKCQETLALPAWWRQAKEQAKPFQTATLVFSSNHRPIYWVLRLDEWQAYVRETVYRNISSYKKTSTRSIYDKLSKYDDYDLAVISLDGDELVIVQNEYFIKMRRDMRNEK